jgi:microsomal epoxide hydrolase
MRHVLSNRGNIVSNFDLPRQHKETSLTKDTERIFVSALLAGLLLAPGVAAQAQTKKGGEVTTADAVKIHYIEAGQAKTTGRIRVGGPPPKAGDIPKGDVVISDIRQQPAILFVPGWTMPGWIWEKQIAHFSKTHRVVAMDPRGQGESSKPTEGYFPAARARDIKAVVDRLKLAPVVLVGWSMGVTEVVAYVDKFGTQDLAGIVLVDGIAGGDPDPKMLAALMGFAGNFLKEREKFSDGFVRSMYKKPQDEKYIARVIAASKQTPTSAATALFVGAFTTDNRAALGKIDKPTLICTAPGRPWDALHDDMQKRIAGARLEKFAGAGHALFVDEADKFNALLDDFLKALK